MSFGASLISVTSVVRLRVDCAAKARTPARLATMDTEDLRKQRIRIKPVLKGCFHIRGSILCFYIKLMDELT